MKVQSRNSHVLVCHIEKHVRVQKNNPTAIYFFPFILFGTISAVSVHFDQGIENDRTWVLGAIKSYLGELFVLIQWDFSTSVEK